MVCMCIKLCLDAKHKTMDHLPYSVLISSSQFLPTLFHMLLEPAVGIKDKLIKDVKVAFIQSQLCIICSCAEVFG